MENTNLDLNSLKKRLFNYLGIIILVVGTNLLQYYVVGNYDTSIEIQTLIDQLIPVTSGVVTGGLFMMIKQGSFDKLFQKMLNDGHQTFTNTASQVETVVNVSTRTELEVKKLAKEVKISNENYEQTNKRIDGLFALENSYKRLEKKLDIYFQNNPDLVKTGVAKMIASVDKNEG